MEWATKKKKQPGDYARAGLLAVLLLAFSGCATTGPGVTMDPFTPKEIGILVNAGTETYLNQHHLSREKLQGGIAYLQAAHGSVQSGTLDLMKVRAALVLNVPEEWRPMANVTWILLLKRVHIEQLIAEGQYTEARAYLNAALEGALAALQARV